MLRRVVLPRRCMSLAVYCPMRYCTRCCAKPKTPERKEHERAPNDEAIRVLLPCTVRERTCGDNRDGHRPVDACGVAPNLDSARSAHALTICPAPHEHVSHARFFWGKIFSADIMIHRSATQPSVNRSLGLLSLTMSFSTKARSGTRPLTSALAPLSLPRGFVTVELRAQHKRNDVERRYAARGPDKCRQSIARRVEKGDKRAAPCRQNASQ